MREITRAGEAPASAARRLAAQKALQVAAGLGSGLVLSADTIVWVQARTLGKPATAAGARRMLRMLSGRTHRVVTGVAVCGPGGSGLRTEHAVTCVRFRRLTREEIAWYVATGDPMDKAGAYGIQGGGALFVREIRGSYSNVVGLPMELVYGLLGLPA